MNDMKKVWTYRMKTLALLALAGITIVSCGKQLQEMGGDPVAFDTSLTETATKAPLPDNTTFAVMAWYTGQDAWSASASPNFMYNEDVLFDGSAYTYSPVKYWPNNPGDKVTFWAYCPHNAAGLTLRESAGGSAYNNTSATGIPYLDFTTVTGNGLVDLMSADFDASVKDRSKPSLNTPVHFTFRHLLSRVVFHFVKVDDASNNYYVRLTDVSIKGIYQNADHPGAGGSWGHHSNNGDLSVYADATPEELTDNPLVPTTGTDMAVMPIPQTLTETTAKIYISYVVVPKSGGDPVSKEGEFLITGPTGLHPSWVHPAGWDQNYQYTYNVRITTGGNPIIFSASIEPWEDADPWVYHYVD